MSHRIQIVAITVVIGALGCTGDPGGNRDQDISLDMLTSVANTANQNLPTMLDDSTELTNVLAVPGGLVYRHRFVGAGPAPDADTINSEIGAQVRNAACTTPETREGLLERGVFMRYTYADQDHRYITEVEVRLEDCAAVGDQVGRSDNTELDYAELDLEELQALADQGDAYAQSRLGFFYHSGQGVPQNDVQAHMWFNLAASRLTGEDREDAVEARDEMLTQMTPDQVAEAQRLAREWEAAHPR